MSFTVFTIKVRGYYFVSKIYFIHSTKFIEHLLCVRLYSRRWKYGRKHRRKRTVLNNLTFQCREIVNKNKLSKIY